MGMEFTANTEVNFNNRVACIVDYRTDKDTLKSLKSLGIVVIHSDKVDVLDGINGHPDLQMHIMGNKIFVHRNISNRLINEIKEFIKEQYNIIVTDIELNPKYPGDIPFNLASDKKFLIHNIKFTPEEIMEEAEKRSLKVINVKQGYVRCTTLLTDNFIVSSDLGIIETLKNLSIPLLHMNEPIKLKGFDRGFIGGALGYLKINHKSYLFIKGEIKYLKEGTKLTNFIHAQNKDIRVIELGKGVPEDIGGLQFLLLNDCL